MSTRVMSHPPNTGTMGDVGSGSSFDLIQNRIESLSGKMDSLIHIQEKVLNRLDGMSQDIGGIERDMENLKVDKEEIHVLPRAVGSGQGEMKDICQEMSSIMSAVNQRSEQQAQKLEGMEKLVLGIQQVISFIGETVKSSHVMELMLKGPGARKGAKPKDNKGKQAAKRQEASAESVTKKADKKTTSTKANRRTQQISSACEPGGQEPTHRAKLHGPKHFLTSRTWGKFLKDQKDKEGKEKPCLSLKCLKAQKKKKPQDSADTVSLKKQALLLEEVEKLNRENAESLGERPGRGRLDLEAGGSSEEQVQGSLSLVDYLREDFKAPVAEKAGVSEEGAEEESGSAAKEIDSTCEEEIPEPTENVVSEAEALEIPDSRDSHKDSIPASGDHKDASPSPEAEQDQTAAEASSSGKRHVTEEDAGVEDHKKKSRVDGGEMEREEEKQRDDKEEEGEVEDKGKPESEGWATFKADGVEIHLDLKQEVERKRAGETETERKEDENVERYCIDTTAPPAAPFVHRIVSAKPHQINNFYNINRQEILGGGRFGQVHKCVENSSGLTLAAKIIKARSQKEKEIVKNEIQVMNQLDHANLIQLYAAYESRSDIILVLEYVDGGELFDRIIDENYTLMELETVSFIRQICEGLQHMHKMYILHLDLKPENILCVSRLTNKIKIIDFGLARIYKPREKLRVNFGTPEFLAPEVINYDFVSFNTDMWSLGVISYMLLSGLCPFLGDDDNQTLNNILACQWNFDEEEFITISDEAKDFISKLLVVNKTWRMGASEALRHPWLSDPVLHHRLYSKKTMCRSRRSSCVPPTDS